MGNQVFKVLLECLHLVFFKKSFVVIIAIFTYLFLQATYSPEEDGRKDRSYIYPEFNHCFAIFAAIILVQATILFHPIDSNGLLAGLPASSTSGPTSALLHTAGQSPPTPPISLRKIHQIPFSVFRIM